MVRGRAGAAPCSRRCSRSVDKGFGLPSVLLLFLLLVVVVAAIGGLLPALLAAISGSLLANFFFTPPVHTFTIAEGENLLALVVFLVVAGVVSWLVSVASTAHCGRGRARAEAETLAALGGTLIFNRGPASAARCSIASRVRGRHGRRPAGAGATATGRSRQWPASPCRPGPTRATFSVPIGALEVLVVVGSGLSARGCGGPALVRRAGAGRGRTSAAPSRGRGGGRTCRRQRAAHRAARGGLARPPYSAGVDQGLRDEPAPAGCRMDSRGDARAPRDHRRGEPTVSTTLVGNLLDMSRLQTGAMQLVDARRRARGGCAARRSTACRIARPEWSSTSRRHSLG